MRMTSREDTIHDLINLTNAVLDKLNGLLEDSTYVTPERIEIRRKGRFAPYLVTPADIATLKVKYPNVEVEWEARRAAEWSARAPQGKLWVDVPRGLNNWMMRKAKQMAAGRPSMLEPDVYDRAEEG
jgi:hypothetical protein